MSSRKDALGYCSGAAVARAAQRARGDGGGALGGQERVLEGDLRVLEGVRA